MTNRVTQHANSCRYIWTELETQSRKAGLERFGAERTTLRREAPTPRCFHKALRLDAWWRV